mgnify:CR=1 FL=1|tara:strand:+ start:2933 stop:3457 length:525 start_codon:yes stop_codon:yes gene_type:complete
MVKNKVGGSRHKKLARKNVRDTTHTIKMRYASEGESYARVTRHFGGGNVEVQCNDGVMRLCIIRKKFRGRNKRDNNIKVDSMILVGLREWEVIAAKKKPKVDLLYVYNDSQLKRLREAKGLNYDILPEKEKIDLDENVFDFSDEDNDTNEVISTTSAAKTEKKKEDFDFDFDDI